VSHIYGAGAGVSHGCQGPPRSIQIGTA